MSVGEKLGKFATKDQPLRASSLTTFAKCMVFPIMNGDFGFLPYSDEVGPAAHTGTAIGRVAELFHRGVPFDDAMSITEKESQQEGEHGFPKAEWPRVRAEAEGYVTDIDNAKGNRFGEVLVDSLEREVIVEIAPSPDDPTGKPVYVIGHMDQVRRDLSGTLRVWDIKSGKATGVSMISDYFPQLAMYVLGAAQSYGEEVQPGGVIRTRGYTATARGNPQVFFQAPWDYSHCVMFGEAVAEMVAMVRRGVLVPTPCEACRYCECSGIWNCLNAIDNVLQMES